MVINGKRNISGKLIIELSTILKLRKKERYYFESLVRFNQAGTHNEKTCFYQELLSYKSSPVRTVNQDQYEFYNKWYYSAIRELVAIYPVKEDYQYLAKLLKPAIKPSEAKSALETLTRLGLITKTRSGIYKRRDPVISSGETVKSFEVHNFQKAAMELARTALERIPRDERELSTVTMSIDKDTYCMIRKKTAKLRAEIMELARSVKNPEQVYQLNLQLFPMSEQKGRAGK
jgi:uncharacterized protein (TIGR02147 family)